MRGKRSVVLGECKVPACIDMKTLPSLEALFEAWQKNVAVSVTIFSERDGVVMPSQARMRILYFYVGEVGSWKDDVFTSTGKKTVFALARVAYGRANRKTGVVEWDTSRENLWPVNCANVDSVKEMADIARNIPPAFDGDVLLWPACAATARNSQVRQGGGVMVVNKERAKMLIGKGWGPEMPVTILE